MSNIFGIYYINKKRGIGFLVINQKGIDGAFIVVTSIPEGENVIKYIFKDENVTNYSLFMGKNVKIFPI